jgi:acyl transferase domain-containing protein
VRDRREPIAIVGIGCRFPGAPDTEAYWRLLRDGVDAITEVPDSRWDRDSFYDPDPWKPGKMSSRRGGFIGQVDRFDPQFFGISAREIRNMDPQQRLLLEVAWEALEDAGQPPDALAGTSGGVFVGVSSFDYYELLAAHAGNFDAHTGTGNLSAMKANRLSYFFGLVGPSMAVDSACSSSLVAVHLACQSLWSGESALALVGGVHLLLSPGMSVGYSKGGFMAPDGRCKTFDALADGYVRGEGAGIVVLKRLSEAEAQGDRVYAVILGSAVNQDGFSNGITAPNPLSQEAVLRTAYRNAGVSPGQVHYVEAHGTGTKLGDPIEMKALGAVLAEGRPPGDVCAVGSVKTNIGHLEAGAGIAGLIKVALSLSHRLIPPSLHFRTPNPYIPFDELPLRVQETLGPWPATTPSLAGVSSFGFGGTNAHVVLSEAPGAPTVSPDAEDRSTHLLCLSAKTEEALTQLVGRYRQHLGEHPEMSLPDVCHTANAGRSHFSHRLAIMSESRDELSQHLQATTTGDSPTAAVLRGEAGGRKRPRIALLFPGQGCQHANMGRQLFLTQPTFRAILERCAEILRPHLDAPLLEALYGGTGTGSEDRLVSDSAMGAAALFSMEYALAELWSSWGVSADVVMGYGVGEYVAACVAGVFSLEDGLRLIAARGRLARAEFAAEAALVHFKKPRIPLVSTVGGQGVEADPASPEYWVAHLQQPVQLAQGLATIHQQGHEVFLEAGPRPILVALGRQRLAGGTQLWLPSLAPPLSDWRQLATTLGQLYVKGVGVDWRGFDRDYHRRKVALPSYPFQRQRYWLASSPDYS